MVTALCQISSGEYRLKKVKRKSGSFAAGKRYIPPHELFSICPEIPSADIP